MPSRPSVIINIFLAWGIISASLFAQTSGGLQGTVTNSSGAAVPDVRLSVRSLRTGETRNVATNQRGFYAALELSPGRYELTASRPGFSALTVTITAEIGLTRTVNLVLQPGTVSNRSRSSISGTTTGNSSTGRAGTTKTVRELPSNGRHWTQAAYLEAGLAAVRTRQSRRFAATNLALLAAARSARIAPFYSGTTKDCGSLWGRPMWTQYSRRQHASGTCPLEQLPWTPLWCDTWLFMLSRMGAFCLPVTPESLPLPDSR